MTPLLLALLAAPPAGVDEEDGGRFPVALAAGLHASRTDGAPCVYNRPDPRMPDLLICRPEVADLALDTIAACFASAG